VTDALKPIFLSYAAEDEDAARRICEALRAAGLAVWFDRNELRGGDAWDASIRRQIRECALFVPVISAHTETRSEGYFRLEWRLAVERSYQMADDQAFLLPVVVDDTADASARVPDRFRERHWARLPQGAVPPEFVDHVRRVLRSAAPAPPPAVSTHADARPVAAARRRWPLVAAAIAVAAVATGAGVWLWRGTAKAPAAAGVSSAGPGRKSIAVLPFANLTGRAEDAYLADGLQEEILNALARLRDLKVISRTSVAEFRGGAHNVRDIGARLGVGSVLEGSVRREGSTLRLTLQLIDARDDRHLFAANYDRDLGHVLGLQSEVARQVADALAATLSGVERGELERVGTNNGDAYNRYLRAVALLRRPVPGDDNGLVEPTRLLEEATRLDPDYADALALLAQAYVWRYFYDIHASDGALARQAFERALALDPDLPEARLARGLYEMYVTRDLDRALGDLDAVVRLRPSAAAAHFALGLALRRRGRFDDALAHLTRAWDLDPLNHAYETGPQTTLIGLRRYPELRAQIALYLSRFPDEPEGQYSQAAIESFLQHSLEPLRAYLRDHGAAAPADLRHAAEAKIARAEGRYLDAVRIWEGAPEADPLDRAARFGVLYWAAGDARSAERTFRALERDARAALQRRQGDPGVATRLALAQSMLGEHAAALATIDAALAEHPEASDALDGPQLSFIRSIILVRAGRTAEGYAEVERLLRVPFAAPMEIIWDPEPELLLVRADPHYDELINHPPRL